MMPTEISKTILVKAPKGNRATEIKVLGHRDPRGPDNNIYIWVDESDQLHIKMWKANRCYQFKEVVESNGYIELIAS